MPFRLSEGNLKNHAETQGQGAILWFSACKNAKSVIRWQKVGQSGTKWDACSDSGTLRPSRWEALDHLF